MFYTAAVPSAQMKCEFQSDCTEKGCSDPLLDTEGCPTSGCPCRKSYELVIYLCLYLDMVRRMLLSVMHFYFDSFSDNFSCLLYNYSSS